MTPILETNLRHIASSRSFGDLLPEDLILTVLSFADAKDVVSFQQTCARFKDLSNSNDLWRELCRRRWQRWPMYCPLSEERDNGEILGWEDWTWKQRYVWVERDFRRTELRQQEMEGMEWYFNFLPSAGGSSNENESRSMAYFHQGRLFLLKYLWMYPILRYQLVNTTEQDTSEEGGDQDGMHEDFREGLEDIQGEPLQQAALSSGALSPPRPSPTQYVQISTFPPHYVARTSVGGWILWNANVVFFTDGAQGEAELPDQLAMHLDMFHF